MAPAQLKLKTLNDNPYVAIAPGTYTGFNLHIYNEDDEEKSQTKSGSVTFEAGKIYDLGSYDLGVL